MEAINRNCSYYRQGLGVLVAVLTSLSFGGQPAGHRLTIRIGNIKHFQGEIHVGVFTTGHDFPKPKNAVYRLKKVISGKLASVTFTLPGGRYAVAVYQDINSNADHDKNFFGMPKEPFCFSNNVKPRFSAPVFDRCAFTLDKNRSLDLKLINSSF